MHERVSAESHVPHCVALYVLHVKQYFTISLFIFLSLSSSRPEDLMNDIELAAGTPFEHQVIFASQSDISKNSNTSQADFNFFMNRAGGSQVDTCTVHVIVLMCVC